MTLKLLKFTDSEFGTVLDTKKGVDDRSETEVKRMKKEEREAKRMEREKKEAERRARVENVLEAIKRGEIVLSTAFGRYRVTSYRDDSGWVGTHPEDQRPTEMNRRSFMVTLDELEGSVTRPVFFGD